MRQDDQFSAADLPLVDGRVYHLDLAPDELAREVIIVGDPERVPFFADDFLSRRTVDRSHRGFRTITGPVRGTGELLSIVTSGIGTPSLEIVLNEIVALNEIDFVMRRRKDDWEPLTVVRIGTSGGQQPETALGTFVVTDYVVGLDNTGLFYDAPSSDPKCELLEKRVREALDERIAPAARFRGRIHPYAARANQEVSGALADAAVALGIPCRLGITVSSPGFFAEQGRGVGRVPTTVSNLDATLATLDPGLGGLRVENMEMEASFLLYFLGALGYRAGVICAVIDKRREGTFITDFRQLMRDAAQVTLHAFRALRAKA